MTTGAKKIFLGMHRPEWDEYSRKLAGAYVLCNCNQSLQTMDQVRSHWQLGHSDEVVSVEASTSLPEMETLIFELGRHFGAPGLAGNMPIVSPLGTLRWLVAQAREKTGSEKWWKTHGDKL